MTQDAAMEPVANNQPVRDEKGRFPKGVSGNPAGRRKNSKNHIVEMKRSLEVAVRENIKGVDVQNIVQAMVSEAKKGNVAAAKLILDKTVSNASVDDDASDASSGIKIVVENATFGAIQSNQSPTPIEGEVIHEEHNS